MSYGFDDCDAFLASLTNNNFSEDELPADFNLDYNLTNGIQNRQPTSFSSSLSPNSFSSESPHENNFMESIFNTNSATSFENGTRSSSGFTNSGSNAYGYNAQVPELINDRLIKTESTTPSPRSLQNTSNSFIQLKDMKGKYPNTNKINLNNCSISKPHRKEKSSHNMIEKRYRTNINDKIKALRDCVPALRVIVDSSDEEEYLNKDDIELDGLQPAKKLNKATILSKSIEYIKHLELKNDSLVMENEQLKNFINSNMAPVNYMDSSVQFSNANPQNNSHFTGNRHQNGGRNIKNKLLMGGLACMVGTGTFDDFGGNDAKALFAVPIGLIKPFISLIKVFLIVWALVIIFQPLIEKNKKSFQSFFGGKTSSSSFFNKLLNGSSPERAIIMDLIHNTGYSYGSKEAIYKCFELKLVSHKYFNSFNIFNNAINYIINWRTEYIWSTSKRVNNNEDQLVKMIFSLDNQQTYNNEKIVSVLSNVVFNKSSFKENVTSPLVYLATLISNNLTNEICELILQDKSSNDVEIELKLNSLVRLTAEKLPNEHLDALVLKNLIDPSFKLVNQIKGSIMEKKDGLTINSNLIINIYSSIILNYLNENNIAESVEWISKLKVNNESLSLLNFTSLYLILAKLESKNIHSDNAGADFEKIIGELRIWIGDLCNLSLNLNLKKNLIEFLINYYKSLENNTDDDLFRKEITA